ncbi:MAG: hypothetical protein QOJ73_6383 [Streptosporangiaceae bacterium]|nr:hypothetical protein [Streptosporangiaceae bacterium]
MDRGEVRARGDAPGGLEAAISASQIMVACSAPAYSVDLKRAVRPTALLAAVAILIAVAPPGRPWRETSPNRDVT